MKKLDVKKMVLALLCATGMMSVSVSEAKAEGLEASLGADVVSNYVWRGDLLGAASVQPSMGISYEGFSLGAWGSYDLCGIADQELDFVLGYSVGDFSVALTDYYYLPTSLFKGNSHTLEVNLAYTISESCPLSLSVNTNVLNDDLYSTYIEVSYPFTVGSVDMSAAVGCTPAEGNYADGFAVTNIVIGASKSVKVTDDYSMSLFSNFIVNPYTELTFLTFGASF